MAKFVVDYTFHARTSQTVEFASLEEAQEKIAEEVESADFELDADDIDDVDFTVRAMHPVTRDGKEIWTTLVLVSDTHGHQSALASSPLFSAATAQAVAGEG